MLSGVQSAVGKAGLNSLLCIWFLRACLVLSTTLCRGESVGLIAAANPLRAPIAQVYVLVIVKWYHAGAFNNMAAACDVPGAVLWFESSCLAPQLRCGGW